jgi:hypothetical protein
MELYFRLRLAQELEDAAIEGLEMCPSCPWAVVIDNPDDKLFRCQNESCGKVSCRTCRKSVGRSLLPDGILDQADVRNTYLLAAKVRDKIVDVADLRIRYRAQEGQEARCRGCHVGSFDPEMPLLSEAIHQGYWVSTVHHRDRVSTDDIRCNKILVCFAFLDELTPVHQVQKVLVLHLSKSDLGVSSLVEQYRACADLQVRTFRSRCWRGRYARKLDRW